MCFSSLSSRYVRLARTGVENGFMIWSIQVRASPRRPDLFDRDRRARELVLGRADETERAHADGLEVDIARRDLEDAARVSHGPHKRAATHVPKMESLTNCRRACQRGWRTGRAATNARRPSQTVGRVQRVSGRSRAAR